MRERFSHLLVIPAMALSATLLAAGCGDEEMRQDAGLEPAEYEVRVFEEKLAPRQRLAKTTDMRLGVRNTGSETIPNLAITVKVMGEQGRNARDAFAYRDPQENLARPNRPIWSLMSGYPLLEETGVLGDAVTTSPRTFQFGELAPGQRATAVWRLIPVKAGGYRLMYELAPNLHGVGEITVPGRRQARGFLEARILSQPQRLRVTDDGRVVPIGRGAG